MEYTVVTLIIVLYSSERVLKLMDSEEGSFQDYTGTSQWCR